MNSQNITLRPYHNPEGIDESKVPDGWRFRYADEKLEFLEADCRCWGEYGRRKGTFSNWDFYNGTCPAFTYIVPVNS